MNMVRVRSPSPRLAVLACAAALAAFETARASEWSRCAPPQPFPPPLEEVESTVVEADSASLREGGLTVLAGNVVVTAPGSRITAERLHYDREADRIEAPAGGTLQTRELFLEATGVRVGLASRTAELDEARYRHEGSHGRGRGRFVRQDPRSIVLSDGTFTTCDPGAAFWELKAKSLELDRETGTGVARHARLELLGLPVFHTPWISFPWQGQRKTGLLAPSWRASGNAGVELTLPWYLNLAPNYDATLRPRATSERGPVMGGELRYLTRRGAGEIEGEVVAKDRKRGTARSLLSIHHRQRVAPRLLAEVRYRRASDIDYLRDLGPDGAARNSTHLHSFAEVAYESDLWAANGLIDGYQALSHELAPADRPYRLAPRLGLSTRRPERNGQLNFGLDAELARFEHDDGSRGGVRIDLLPSLTLPFRAPSGFLVSRTSVRYTEYDLARVPGPAPSRVVPTLSIDTGLFFDRHFEHRDQLYLQTLEPRLFYLRVPYRDQDDLPLFDTGLLAPGFDHLFRENRFSGPDRIGDANQLTFALDTRLIDSGGERLRASLGQTRYLADRRVGLEPEAPEIDVRADWFAGFTTRPHPQLTLDGLLAWDDRESRTRKLALNLRHKPTPRKIVNLGYRSVAELAEDALLSFRQEFPRRGLSVSGGFRFALTGDEFVQAFAGFEYESCCWRLRLLGQRYPSSGEFVNSVSLQLELKGLARGLGFSERYEAYRIPGLRNDF